MHIFLTLNIDRLFILFFPDVAAEDIEVLTGTEATLTCTVNGITELENSIVWKTKEIDNLSGNAGYIISGADTLETTLTVKAASNTADTIYTCDVTPKAGTVTSTQVSLNVFGELWCKSVVHVRCAHDLISSTFLFYLKILIKLIYL